MKQLYLIIILSFSQINIFAQINCEFLIWSNLGTEKISTMGDNVHFSNAESELPFQVYDGQIYYLNKSRLSIYKSDLEGNLSDTIFLDSDLPELAHFNVVSNEQIFLFGSQDAFIIDQDGAMVDTIRNMKVTTSALKSNKLFVFNRIASNLTTIDINNFQLDSILHFESFFRLPSHITSTNNNIFLKNRFENKIYRLSATNEFELVIELPFIERVLATQDALFMVVKTQENEQFIHHYDIATSIRTVLFKLKTNFARDFGIIDTSCLASFIDKDQDGYAAPVDCNDEEGAIAPNLIELGENGIDDNCNGIIDDDSDCDIYISVGQTCEPESPIYVIIEGGEAPFAINVYQSEFVVYSDTTLNRRTTINNIAHPNGGFEVEVSSNLGCFKREPLRIKPAFDCIRDVFLTSQTDGSTIISVKDLAFNLYHCSEDYAYISIKKDGLEIMSGQLPLVMDLTGVFTFQVSFPSSSCYGNLTVEGSGIADNDEDGYGTDDDCDDSNPDINPGAEEVANNEVDEDCDGEAQIIDIDNDGYNSDEDCDDNDADINPGAEEIVNNEVDENCDGEARIIDVDSDGYNSDEDCDDNNADINPGAEEIANNEVDEDCDGEVQVIDVDNDGYNSDEDCDDNNADINPGAEEIANNTVDEDCDGEAQVIDVDNDGYNSDEDCDDNNADINPGAEEIANNDVDENCDGMDLLSSIKETNPPSISIYPNPTDQFLFIENSKEIDYELRIYDLKGLQLLDFTNKDQIDLLHLSTGVYIIELLEVLSGKRIIEKIVLLR